MQAGRRDAPHQTSMAPVTERLREVGVTRIGRSGEGRRTDLAAVEEPLEVRLHGRPFAVIMRTPGDDRALASGFLLSEGVIESAGDLGAVEHCRHPDHPEQHNVVDVFLLGRARKSLDARLAERRHVVAHASCGMCGRVSIESLTTRAAALPVTWSVARDLVAGLPERLRAQQAIFAETGGLHAAGLFATDGACEHAAEDVGRHNAVDKVIGAMLLNDRLPLAGHTLVVSGRTSFEIIQKTWMGGIGLVCAVSAPTSLAVELADRAGITLLGFVRDGGFNVYTHPERIRD
ncbi:MAG TPA: formate dehydrogenase accessory sulfurtransferase FdhD [Vicinamibacterales bacterium]|nr:formate dehydrogenase accessory sulfurtransferase FdhD [Vicinamibacterales bacterium]